MPLRRVLCVGGDGELGELLRLALVELGGVALDFAAGAGEALGHLGERPPELILIDASLPGTTLTAIFAALQARAAPSRIPILVLSTKAGPRERAQYQALGAAGVVALPVDPIALLAQIRASWAEGPDR